MSGVRRWEQPKKGWEKKNRKAIPISQPPAAWPTNPQTTSPTPARLLVRLLYLDRA